MTLFMLFLSRLSASRSIDSPIRAANLFQVAWRSLGRSGSGLLPETDSPHISSMRKASSGKFVES